MARLALASLGRWFDSSTERPTDVDGNRIDWLRTAPFIAVHLACLAVFLVGVSRLAIEIAIGLYVLRMFAITVVKAKIWRTTRASSSTT